MIVLSDLPRDQVYRYLGYRAQQHNLTPELEKLIDASVGQVLRIAEPRAVCTPALELKDENGSLWAGSLELPGRDIRAHLDHCSRAVLMAVTLGAPLDALLRRTEVLDMARAVILDAAANVAIEAAADQAEEALRSRIRENGQYLTIRYSPGYGDFPLTAQRELLRLADAPLKIGLSATASSMMTPRKSITAVLGVADVHVTGKRAGCGSCAMRNNCIYRKRGTTCD